MLGFSFTPLVLSAFSTERTGEDDEEAEGRDYASLPDFPKSLEELSTFPERFDAFFNDQFPLRLPLVKLSSVVRFRVFDVSPNPAVLVGRDGWFDFMFTCSSLASSTPSGAYQIRPAYSSPKDWEGGPTR